MPSNLYHSVKAGSLELPGNLFLAPVAGYTDSSFRAVCAKYGADFSYTELASAEALARGHEKTFALVKRARGEKKYAVQLFGADPETMGKAAAALRETRPDAVDINCGCPVPKVVKLGAGAAMMKDPANMARVVEAVVRAANECLDGVPVTVKMRSGWDSASINYRECAAAVVEAGAAAVCLHPRTRAQGYSGKSDREQIADLVSRLKVPVFGSGDLYAPEDAVDMLKTTGCAAVMFARGAEGNPFIFKMTRDYMETGAWKAPPPEERFAAAFEQLEYRVAELGEYRACLEMRKTFCAYAKGPCGSPGLPGAARLREAFVAAETVARYREIINAAMPSAAV